MKNRKREIGQDKYVTTKRNRVSPGTFMIILAVLIGISILSAGCIKNAQHLVDGGGVTDETDPGISDTGIPEVTPTAPTPIPVPVLTPAKSNIVTEVAPILTPNPYAIQHAPRINQTPQYSFLYRQPEFTKTYTLTGNAYGLLVNVVQGPLYIKYTVNPKYDCLSDPDSCRGTVLAPVNRPYMTITVRDNQTGQIVAQDGYAREYSSDTGTYNGYSGSDDTGDVSASTTFSSAESDDNSEGYSNPAEDSKGEGPRYIPVYREGQFQITVEGNYLDTTLSIITGTSPNPLDMTEKSTAGNTAPSSNNDDW